MKPVWNILVGAVALMFGFETGRALLSDPGLPASLVGQETETDGRTREYVAVAMHNVQDIVPAMEAEKTADLPARRRPRSLSGGGVSGRLAMPPAARRDPRATGDLLSGILEPTVEDAASQGAGEVESGWGWLADGVLRQGGVSGSARLAALREEQESYGRLTTERGSRGDGGFGLLPGATAEPRAASPGAAPSLWRDLAETEVGRDRPRRGIDVAGRLGTGPGTAADAGRFGRVTRNWYELPDGGRAATGLPGADPAGTGIDAVDDMGVLRSDPARSRDKDRNVRWKDELGILDW